MVTCESKPRGYALLMGVLLLTFAMTIAFSLTSQATKQIKSSTRFVNSAQALAAADAGLEKAFWLDRDSDSGTASFNGTGYSPFTDSSHIWYSVTRSGTAPKIINSRGYSFGATRSIQASY
jgi:hypothetical protein